MSSSAIDGFYEEEAAAYALVSEDRDFAAQAAFLFREVATAPSDGRFLELFAGPARHSFEMRKLSDLDCIAIDAAAGMKKVAVAAGSVPESSYIVARIPPLPALDGTFVGASLLRYSVGYLSPAEVIMLLTDLKRYLLPGARLCFELHDLDLLRDDFADLAIRERTIVDANGSGVRCVWPNGRLRWSSDDWIVEMDVLVQLLAAGKVVRERQFTSVERIYAVSELVFLAQMADGWRHVPVKTDAFPGSRIVVLERQGVPQHDAD